jgi:2-keto-4-pentenoate hydratase
MLALAPTPARAACPSLQDVARIALALLDRGTPPPPPAALTMADAACMRDRMVGTLSQPWGDQVGWKIAGTRADPMVGALFFGTLRERPDTTFRPGEVPRLPAAYGLAPHLGAGLLLRIRYDGVGEVGDDHLSLLRHLDAVMPFLDLGDRVWGDRIWRDATTGPALLLGINLGTRLGVVGEAIEPEPTPAFARALGQMTVTLEQGAQQATATGPGPAGHPLDALGWFARAMRDQGRRLQVGEHVAIMLGPAFPAATGEARLTLIGLGPAPAGVAVHLD